MEFGDPQFITTMAEICGDQHMVADAADMWKRFLDDAISLHINKSSPPQYISYKEAWKILFENTFRDLNLNGNITAAVAHLKNNLSKAKAFSETKSTINTLAPYYKLALLSNADNDFLFPCLKNNNLTFETVVSSEEVSSNKPNPAIFHHLSTKLSLSPKHILYVGDNPLLDVQGAKNAGLPVAWINRNNTTLPQDIDPPNFILPSLSDLIPILVPKSDYGT